MTGHYVIFEGKGRAKLREFEVTPPRLGEVLLENDYMPGSRKRKVRRWAWCSTGASSGSGSGRRRS